jgi:hypothetical protein
MARIILLFVLLLAGCYSPVQRGVPPYNGPLLDKDGNPVQPPAYEATR